MGDHAEPAGPTNPWQATSILSSLLLGLDLGGDRAAAGLFIVGLRPLVLGAADFSVSSVVALVGLGITRLALPKLLRFHNIQGTSYCTMSVHLWFPPLSRYAENMVGWWWGKDQFMMEIWWLYGKVSNNSKKDSINLVRLPFESWMTKETHQYLWSQCSGLSKAFTLTELACPRPTCGPL